MYLRTLLFLTLATATLATLPAQDILIGSGATVDACSGTFYDSGGPGSGHAAPGGRETITICSAGGADDESHVELAFSFIDIIGTLTIFNGPDITADTLTVIDRTNNGNRITATATAANPSGCLTVVFESVGNKEGWVADIGCVTACQPVVATVAEAQPIDVCVGEALTLTGAGRYPENNTLYSQSDATSTFAWKLGNDSTAEGRQITYVYDRPGGYLVDLEITDERGCTSTNATAVRVRVPAPPLVIPDPPGELLVCPGEPVVLTVANDPAAAVDFGVRPQQQSFVPPPAASDRIDIPSEGTILQTSLLRVRKFQPDQFVTTGSDIEEICLSIEHSYIGDLSIWVECPDGNRVDLMRFDGTGQGATNQRFGYPDRVAEEEPAPPLTYCFTATALRTVDQVARTLASTPGAPSTMPPQIKYLPVSGNYDAFIGCPLNGDWTLNVFDQGDGDNGTVYEWAITFADALQPVFETFTIPLGEVAWEDSGLHTNYTPATIEYVGSEPGFVNQRLVVTDSVGCRYDTLIPVGIRSPYAGECFTCAPAPAVPVDTALCAGQSYDFDFTDRLTQIDTNLRWTARTDELVNHAAWIDSGGYVSTLQVTDQLPLLFGSGRDLIGEVCIDYADTEGLDGLSVTLVSPGGAEIVLVSAGEASGGSLQRCFTPSDDWSVLAGTAINGEWRLRLQDERTNATGRLLSWSVSLLRQPEVTYAWSPVSPDFSCTDCTDPTIVPTAAGDYTLTATTADGCTSTVELRITLTNFSTDIVGTVIDGCAGANEGAIRLQVAGDTSALSFAWSTGDTTTTIGGLADGVYQVTVSAGAGCSQIYPFTVAGRAGPELTLASLVEPSCAGRDNGSLATTTRGGTAPYTYVWADDASRAGGDAGALPAGSYALTVIDSAGCTDSLAAELTEPTPLSIGTAVTDIGCGNGATGEIVATVTGGTPGYTFSWSNGAMSPTISDLPAGTYSLTVTDRNGCTQTDDYTLSATESLTATARTETAECGGSGSGRVVVSTSGGVGPYRYRLVGGTYGPDSLFTGLDPATYTFEVADARGCETTATATVTDEGNFSVDLGGDREINFGDSLLLSPVFTGGAGFIDIQYTADYPGTLSCTDCPNPSARPPATINYEISAIDESGCETSDRIRLTVRKVREVAVPTAFSPNDDTRNDRLLVHGRPGTQVVELAVFDRWGGIQFIDRDFGVNDPSRGWDGNGINGKPLNAGVYVYRLTVRYEDGSEELLSGQTTLIR